MLAYSCLQSFAAVLCHPLLLLPPRSFTLHTEYCIPNTEHGGRSRAGDFSAAALIRCTLPLASCIGITKLLPRWLGQSRPATGVHAFHYSLNSGAGGNCRGLPANSGVPVGAGSDATTMLPSHANVTRRSGAQLGHSPRTSWLNRMSG